MAEEKLLDIEIVTPREKIYEGRGTSISLQGSLSGFQVLYNHAPIVSSLDSGIAKLADESGNKVVFATGSGFAEVRQNEVSVLVENAENAGKINAEEEKKALEETRSRIAKAESREDKDLLVSELQQIKNRIKAAESL